MMKIKDFTLASKNLGEGERALRALQNSCHAVTEVAPGFWFGGTKQNFINKFLSSPVLQWRHQNFGSGGTFSKTHQRLLKIFKNL